jgi:hypothetical protein
MDILNKYLFVISYDNIVLAYIYDAYQLYLIWKQDVHHDMVIGQCYDVFSMLLVTLA